MVCNVKRAIVASRLRTQLTKRAHMEIEATKENSKDFKRYICYRLEAGLPKWLLEVQIGSTKDVTGWSIWSEIVNLKQKQNQ